VCFLNGFDFLILRPLGKGENVNLKPQIMFKDLYLLRHAEAMEKQPGQTDKERELSTTGLQNATRMGIFLKGEAFLPEIILSSSANRTLQTASLVAEQLKYDTQKIHENPEIYEASTRTLLVVINQLRDQWNTVLLVGHNPSITYLAEYVTGAEIGHISTCGLVHIRFPLSSWEEVTAGNGQYISYKNPESLQF
jgi:phosphohistidine phosphatase